MTRKTSGADVVWIFMAALIAAPIAAVWWLYSVIGPWGMGAIVFVLVGAGVWWWRKSENTDDTALLDTTSTVHESTRSTDWSGERLTEKQISALVSASLERYIYDRQSSWRDANQNNSYHEKTLSSLAMRGLLDCDGRGRCRLTSAGYDLLIQRGHAPGLAWRPSPWASIKIKYRDSEDEVTERHVDVFELDRFRFHAYCRLRNGEARTFAIDNVIDATDASTGNRIDDIEAWLKGHSR